MQEQDVIREFLIESSENLNRLDQEILDLERRPQDAALIASIFRTIHTIKGSCGFLGFGVLEGLAHQAESLLSKVRSGERPVDGELIALALETIDKVRLCLNAIEKTGVDSSVDCEALVERLREAASDGRRRAAAPLPEPAPPEVERGAGTDPAAEGDRACASADASIRIDVGLLDKLMNLVGELVLARNQVLQFAARNEDAALSATSQRLNLITTELQESVMKTRMQPVGLVWNKLPRLVRDVALARGKQVRLEMDGAGTELDKTLIEAIKDPITHIVRNCCDHGIESPQERARAGKPAQGTIYLKAFHEGGQVNIEIGDDGAGIDVALVRQRAVEKGLLRREEAERLTEREAQQLILLPGVSTARQVTSVSGRGVGMDVVRVNIEKVGGAIDIVSAPGRGSTFKLKIPLTLAIIPGLIVTSGGERFIIPQASLVELIRLDGDAAGRIESVHGTPVYRRRGALLPIARLNQVLGLTSAAGQAASIVVLQVEDRQFGLVVDGIQDTQEIVVKPLGKQLKGLSVYAGATIMGDGRVALILDVVGVGQRSGVLAQRGEQARADEAKASQSAGERQRLLLFRAGSFERIAAPLSLVGRLEEFPRSMLEQAGGRRVVQYRGGILQLTPLASLLEPDASHTANGRDPAQVIVFSDGVRSLGVLVDAILDIVEDTIGAPRAAKRAGLLGSAVLGGQVTDFLDVRAVLDSAAEAWLGARRAGATVLVAESSPFVRGLLRTELELAGYRVLEAADSDGAQHTLAETRVDTVVAADLPQGGFASLTAALAERKNAGRPIPAIALGHSLPKEGPDPFAECLASSDRDGILASLARLAGNVMDPAATRKEPCRL